MEQILEGTKRKRVKLLCKLCLGKFQMMEAVTESVSSHSLNESKLCFKILQMLCKYRNWKIWV